MHPLVSIIIPVYNNEAFIAGTIQSALDQTWPYKEIIVVDDGSSDNSYAIAKKFETNTTVKVYSCLNSGAATARNFGYQYCTGTYIQYLDADDLLHPDKIRFQVELLNGFSPDYISSCSWAHFTDDTRHAEFFPQEVWKDLSPVEWLITAWNGGGMMQTACWLTPRVLIDQAGLWDESLKKNPNDDGEFFARVLLKTRGVKFCEASKVYYRKHHGYRVSRQKDKIAASSLLGTCVSYQKHIFAVEKSERTVEAVALNYSRFIYQFHGLYPELVASAEKMIRELGYNDIPVAGGIQFQQIARVIGFKNALFLKHLFGRA